ncbi:restriction endonuclease subunit S [Lactococcus petauri]|uniref:restriction endonuclease subunit S n=2 Tax=Lactococcus petauri TaxID=1940789 RepID=UPI0022E80A0A|nr:restriction endonuclease subunit S [Lactococcus petauri]
MMSKKGPQLRFEGFTDDWEERKLGEVGYFYYGKSAPKWSVTEDAETPCVRYGELYTKYGAKISNIYSHTNINPKNLKFSTGNEVLVPRVGENPLDFSLCSWLSIPNVAIGEMISVYNTNENPLFISYYFRGQMKYEFAKRVEGGNVSNLYYSYLEDIDLYIPKLEEQIAISKFFEKLDDTIALHQRKLDLLKEQKKGYLQKMFPKNGEKVPELRFAGFADDWEERKLSDIADRFDNLRVPITASDRKPGDTPYYGANGIQDYVEGFTHNGEFILVAEDGANDLKNYPVQYVNGKVWVNNHAHVLQGKKTITDNKFLMNAIKNFNIEPFLVGGGRAKLNADVMMKLNILLPTFVEQEKIGSLFSLLDKTIALHQRKLDLLKEQKKGFLQKMFV